MPQPIDPNTELARMTAAERIQQIADRASLAAQHRQRTQTEDDLVRAETQVHETEAKSDKVDPELKRRNPYRGRRRRHDDSGEDDSESRTFYSGGRKAVAEPDEHDLDVSV